MPSLLVASGPVEMPARVCMGMLARTGGSSVVAQEVGEGLAARGVPVRYCHLDAAGLRPELDFHIDAVPGNASSMLLDVPPALGGGLDAVTVNLPPITGRQEARGQAACLSFLA